MSVPRSQSFVHAVMADGTEVFGIRAFPFRREHLAAVAFEVGGGTRRLLTEEDATFQLMDPETFEGLPSEALWLQANDDEVLRGAVKDRCGL